MNRRAILTGAAASAAGLPLTWGASHAQQAGKVYRVGVLLNRNNPSPETESLRTGLTQLGYVEGTNVVYEVRPAEGQLDRLPGFAAELVSKGVDVIVSYGGPPTNAARKATTTIPIVFTLVADPVAIGAAATLERPGGNLTGVTNNDPELPVRHMALLKQMIPKLARVAIFSDADIPGADANGLAPIDRANVAAARAAGLTPQVLKLRGPKPDFDAAFKAMANEGAGGAGSPGRIRYFQNRCGIGHGAAHPDDVVGWTGGRGRPDVLRYKLHVHISSRTGVCRQDPQGRKARGHGG
jgi:putative ABC transport system substrate-binding protein